MQNFLSRRRPNHFHKGGIMGRGRRHGEPSGGGVTLWVGSLAELEVAAASKIGMLPVALSLAVPAVSSAFMLFCSRFKLWRAGSHEHSRGPRTFWVNHLTNDRHFVFVISKQQYTFFFQRDVLKAQKTIPCQATAIPSSELVFTKNQQIYFPPNQQGKVSPPTKMPPMISIQWDHPNSFSYRKTY